MAAQDQESRKKGTFSSLRLPVTRKYIMPASRTRMLVIGGIGALGILGYTVFNLVLQKGSFISNGPLSSSHANVESDCVSCHKQEPSLMTLAAVTNEKCSACHEKFGDKIGVYTFAAHYVYRSDDLSRLVPSEKETPCFSCHKEHLGREAEITNVPDSRCLPCHPFGSFNERHPQFEFLAKNLPDNPGIRFPHIMHVKELRKKENLLDIEKACLYCHIPDPDGKQFRPISFDRSCDACHLTTSTATPALPVAGRGGAPGVETLAGIRAREGTAALWAYYTSENEFVTLGDRIRKSPVYHKDPWIMDNLARLRDQLYPDIGLASLLQSSADLPPQKVRVLYREAIATLREYATGLRSRPEPEIRSDLREINTVLDRIEQKLDDPYTPLDDTKFLLGTLVENPKLTGSQINEIKKVVNELTKPCQQCHIVSNATITRVRSDLRVLRRAEFNHRDHILQRRCLECHTAIPIAEALESNAKIDESRDRATIRNIPGIETCQQCHQPEQASNRCITCHYFHPNKTQRSNLLLYVQ